MDLPDIQPGSIGVFDSGIGGLTVANAISDLLPRENLVYIADTARAPYGPRPPRDILTFSLGLTEGLLNLGCKMIVVACNTATAHAIDTLREFYPHVPFVGMEPAVKPAARGRRILVMATAATLASARYRELRDKHLIGKHLLETSCPGLVEMIESADPGIPAYLATLLAEAREDEVDTVVLGCTHFPFVSEEIAALLGPDTNIIDPAPAAARQVERLLRERELLGAGPRGQGVYLATGPVASMERVLGQTVVAL